MIEDKDEERIVECSDTNTQMTDITLKEIKDEVRMLKRGKALGHDEKLLRCY